MFFVSNKYWLIDLGLWDFVFFLTLKGMKRIVPTVRQKNNIKKPNPKFLGKSMFDSKICWRAYPPMKLPKLFEAKPIPKNFPRWDCKVLWFKNSAHIGTIIPIERAYKRK